MVGLLRWWFSQFPLLSQIIVYATVAGREDYKQADLLFQEIREPTDVSMLWRVPWAQLWFYGDPVTNMRGGPTDRRRNKDKIWSLRSLAVLLLRLGEAEVKEKKNTTQMLVMHWLLFCIVEWCHIHQPSHMIFILSVGTQQQLPVCLFCQAANIHFIVSSTFGIYRFPLLPLWGFTKCQVCFDGRSCHLNHRQKIYGKKGWWLSS